MKIRNVSIKYLTPKCTVVDDKLIGTLINFEEVSMFLQSDSPRVNLFYVRQLFDGLIQEIPILKGYYLSASAEIVHNKAFENGIVKLQRGDAPTRDKANTLQILKL